MYIQHRFPAIGFILLALIFLLPTPPCSAHPEEFLPGKLISPDPEVREAALSNLRDKGQRLLPALTEALHSGDRETRRGAAVGLSFLPTPGLGAAALIQGLTDEDAAVRSLCAHGLGKIGAPAARTTARLLTHSDGTVRVAAALALSRMGGQAVPELTRLLALKDPMVTARTAWLLGSMGSDALPAVPALIRALETDDMRVVHVVAEAIDAIGPDPALASHELTLLGWNRANCPATRVGRHASFTLVKLLARPGTPLAGIALHTLVRIGPEAEPALRFILNTGNDSQRTAAALLITGIDPTLARTLPDDLRSSLSTYLNQ